MLYFFAIWIENEKRAKIGRYSKMRWYGYRQGQEENALPEDTSERIYLSIANPSFLSPLSPVQIKIYTISSETPNPN